MKNKLTFYLITLVIYLAWMAGIIIAQQKGLQEMMLTILFLVIYLHIGINVFDRLHFRYYEGLHKDSVSDSWFNILMCWLAWPAAIINFIMYKKKKDK
ncbi:MAG: hypothetical protein IJ504_00905 [Bacteroidales bacterium]|nr:hypothetical protein [Bacteroidales bacterium]